MKRVRIARYVDGTEVREGDKIKYRQADGGVLPPGGYRYGVAKKFPYSEREREAMMRHNEKIGMLWLDPEELHLFDGESHFNIVGHVVHKVVE